MPILPQPISIRMFLPDGTPEGLRIIEKSLWTGVCVRCPRSRYPDARTRSEFARPGVYVLVAPHPENPLSSVVYIGQAEDARQRLDQHLAKKDFWEALVLFTDKGGAFNSAHFRYLEARLVQVAHAAKRAKVENGNLPTPSTLSESDRADTEAFLRDMLIIYPLVGIDAFEEPPQLPIVLGSLLTLAATGLKASGQESADGLVVHKGSHVWREALSFHDKSYRLLRRQLIQSGVITMSGDEGVFAQDFAFKSPSAAASVVRGMQQNGLEVWKDAAGRSLKAIQAASIPLAAE